MFMIEIEAGLHAFVADAASFRDLLAEACWKLTIRSKENDVRTMATFLRRAKGTTNEVAKKIIREGSNGGWIKNLTDIRNDIIHVVPVSQSQEFTMCDLRILDMEKNGIAHILHFPFVNADWSMRKPVDPIINFSEKNLIRKSLEDYQVFAKTSGDALEYVWQTTSHLVSLVELIRLEAGLDAPIPELNSLGPITIVN